jgi:hypothetical protein
MDGNSIAAVIGACSAAVIGVGTFTMQFITWKDNRDIKLRTQRLEAEGTKREGKIDALHSQVNGRLGELKIRIAKEAYEMGRKFQRDNGDAPSPEFPKPKVEELMEQVRDSSNQTPIG